jgi:dihydroorotate dehydrogenase electron transfer subunit
MKIETQGFIESHKVIGKETFHCKIFLPYFKDSILPGQFVQISCPGSNSVFLKRPISVFSYEANHLEIIYKVVGLGTKNISKLKIDQAVEIILPLGNYFTPPQPSSHILLISGGIGIAPIYFYLNYYKKLFPSATFTLLSGVSRQEEEITLDLPNPFPGNIMFHIDSKDDINQGNLLEFYAKQTVENVDFAIACGPLPMMKAFSDHFHQKNIPIEVSLESSMACGYGVCLGCAFSTKEGSKTVCVDGPIFSSNIIDWNKVWTH